MPLSAIAHPATFATVSGLSAVRDALRSRRNDPNPVVRYSVRSLSAAYRLVLLSATAEDRSSLVARLRNSRDLYQTNAVTWPDRYPGIFAACRSHIGDGTDRRILSFGCSTGDEVLTLRRYFPAATIVGAEINRRSLAICRRLPVDPGITFIALGVRRFDGTGPTTPSSAWRFSSAHLTASPPATPGACDSSTRSRSSTARSELDEQVKVRTPACRAPHPLLLQRRSSGGKLRSALARRSGARPGREVRQVQSAP